MRSSSVPSDGLRGTSRKDRGLGFHPSNLIDNLGIGERRDVASILVIRNRSEKAERCRTTRLDFAQRPAISFG